MGRACNTLWEKRNSYMVLVGKSEGMRPLGRPRRRREGNTKPDLREIVWGGMDLIHLDQDRERWTPVNTVIKYK
jgi:hypothetical protein